MNARIESEPGPVKNRTTVERTSDREVVVTRTINGPARIVFEAFTKAELLKRWWVPKSMGMTLLSCEVDARVGGKSRLEFDIGGPEPAAFFGTYVEAKPYSRLAWTNEEGSEGGPVITVTFEEKGRQYAGGPARELSFEGSARRCRHRSSRCNGRDVRSAGRASRRSG
jgi:uncharacterized protein YndB with AHSA1/START domain